MNTVPAWCDSHGKWRPISDLTRAMLMQAASVGAVQERMNAQEKVITATRRYVGFEIGRAQLVATLEEFDRETKT